MAVRGYKGSGKKPRPEKMPSKVVKSKGWVTNSFSKPSPRTRQLPGGHA